MKNVYKEAKEEIKRLEEWKDKRKKICLESLAYRGRLQD